MWETHPLISGMNSATKGRLIGLFGLVCFAVWMTLSLGSSVYLCLASSRWPTVPVRVTSSAVSTGVSNAGRWWEPEVAYEYKIHGRVYRSNAVRYMMPLLYHEEAARDIQAAYPQDARATAAVNPANPAQSVLEPGIPAGMWWRALLPLFAWTLAGYIFYEIGHPERRFMLLPDVEPAE